MINTNNQQLSEELVATAKENEFLTIEQAAIFLGYKTSTLYKKIALVKYLIIILLVEKYFTLGEVRGLDKNKNKNSVIVWNSLLTI